MISLTLHLEVGDAGLRYTEKLLRSFRLHQVTPGHLSGRTLNSSAELS